MICPNCGSQNVNIQAVTEIKPQRHGVLWWLFIGWWWVPFKWMGFFLFALIFKLFKKQKIKSVTHSEAVCQSCGKRWIVG